MPTFPDPSTFHRGPRPGLLGDVAAMHGRYYAAHWSFPTAFECKVSSEMAAFLNRYDSARDLTLSVDGADGRIAASITLDVSDPQLTETQGHIRWFVIGDDMRGKGLGGAMLGAVIAHSKAIGLRSLYLTTFRGLDAAAAVYAKAGFRIVDEQPGATWGRTVTEQRLEIDL